MSAQETGEEYFGICKQLDDLAICILKTLHEIISERQYLDDNLREGYICMAKSRYLMRGQKIDILQVDTSNLHATKKIFCEHDTIEKVEFLNFKILETDQVILDANCMKYRSSQMLENKLGQDFEHLSIKRGNSNNLTAEISEKEKETSSNNKDKDPLYWFGVLTPASLKKCQSHFQQAVATAAKIASLQSQLKSFAIKYRELRKGKDNLKKV
ncbi:coiled-coil domain-containing protein 115-like [Stegodyphus dumicola]|uniref:coiled-coil domain-containing protein 115-like n=1 Tax=Stegodyphus dumicola TaxID=202533 RepID=UPI0015AB6C2A|nr:coiled-coil domain-containing protein 115-like [Stegodyphus dumicola]